MIEEWRDIVGYENKYKVSNMGKVMSLNYLRTGKQNCLVYIDWLLLPFYLTRRNKRK